MAPQLIKMSGDFQEKAYPIDKAKLIIGRSDEADIKLASKFASRTHAELYYADGIYTLYVPDGKKVEINGKPAAGQIRIVPGDIIDFPEERFTFGEMKVAVGPKPKPKADPVKLAIPVVLVLMLGYFGYSSLTRTTTADAPQDVSIDVSKLKAIVTNNPDPGLQNLNRDIFYRGDYVKALDRLKTEVSSEVPPETKQTIHDVILELVMRKIANQYMAGIEHFQTQQYEAARTDFNTIVRLKPVFVDDDPSKTDANYKLPLPHHPRMVSPKGDIVTYTVKQALDGAERGIQRCDDVLAGKPDPGPTDKKGEAPGGS